MTTLHPLASEEPDEHEFTEPTAVRRQPTSQQQQIPATAAPAPAVTRVDWAGAFRRELAAETINLRALRRLAYSGGVPDDDKGLRIAVWRCLLHYLPEERAQWAKTLARKRAEYRQFCEDLIIDPSKFNVPGGVMVTPESQPNPLLLDGATLSSTGSSGLEGNGSGSLEGALHRMALSQEDHPLSTSDGSKWKAYFQDAEVQEQIERDVQRTHPDMHFFSASGPAAQQHRREMQRALFVFAKLNPGIRYVQGMNELLAPLYYLCATDPEEGAAAHAEADAFYLLVDLMGEFRDHFCKQLDNSTVGIKATMARLSQFLRAYDEELWQHLEVEHRINPQFYAFRWITLLLTQEFSFPDALRLWDCLLSDPHGRLDCLLRLCIAMLLNVREELMQGDFAANMKLLQRYPPVDVHVILCRAEALKDAKRVIVLE